MMRLMMFHSDSFTVPPLESQKTQLTVCRSAGEVRTNVSQGSSKSGSAAQMKMHNDDNSSEDRNSTESTSVGFPLPLLNPLLRQLQAEELELFIYEFSPHCTEIKEKRMKISSSTLQPTTAGFCAGQEPIHVFILLYSQIQEHRNTQSLLSLPFPVQFLAQSSLEIQHGTIPSGNSPCFISKIRNFWKSAFLLRGF